MADQGGVKSTEGRPEVQAGSTRQKLPPTASVVFFSLSPFSWYIPVSLCSLPPHGEILSQALVSRKVLFLSLYTIKVPRFRREIYLVRYLLTCIYKYRSSLPRPVGPSVVPNSTVNVPE